MSHVLSKNSYGKSQVRLSKIIRHAQRHELIELSANIELEGEFAESYTAGDNSRIVATDTMKNTVYALAASNPMHSIESFAQTLANHFLEKFAHVSRATVEIRQDRWERVAGDHPHAFVSGGNEKRTCRVVQQRLPVVMDLRGGIDGLVVVKTTHSEFTGFLRDAFTTLPETTDRMMGTSISAEWSYLPGTHDFNEVYGRARAFMIDIFAASTTARRVQETLHEMGRAVLDACKRN